MTRGEGGALLRGYTDLTVVHPSRLWPLYRAFDIEMSQWIALRVIRAGAVQPYLLDELAADIGVIAALADHPNLVTIHRFTRRDDGSVTIATELCRESYRDRLRRDGNLEVAEVLRAAHAVASALDGAARDGLSHGDVRPSKIMLSRGGQIVLGGFGLRRLELATRGAVDIGAHSAPEVWGGTTPSPASDVYSLCSTMYELLAGRPPFEGLDRESPASLVLRIVGESPPPLRASGVPIALADLIAHGLAKDPGARPATASELAKELAEIELDRSDALERLAAGERDPTPAAQTVRTSEQRTVPAPGSQHTDRAMTDPLRAGPPTGTPAQSRPGTIPPLVSPRNVLEPVTAGRGARPVRPASPPSQRP